MKNKSLFCFLVLQVTLCLATPEISKKRLIYKRKLLSPKLLSPDCKNIQCQAVEQQVCVKIKPKLPMKANHSAFMVVSTCEIDHTKCYSAIDLTIVPMKNCFHGNISKSQLKNQTTKDAKIRGKRSISSDGRSGSSESEPKSYGVKVTRLYGSEVDGRKRSISKRRLNKSKKRGIRKNDNFKHRNSHADNKSKSPKLKKRSFSTDTYDRNKDIFYSNGSDIYLLSKEETLQKGVNVNSVIGNGESYNKETMFSDGDEGKMFNKAMFTSKEQPPLSSKKAAIAEKNEAANVQIKETMFSEEDREAMFTSKEKPPLSSKKTTSAERNEAANVKIKETMFSEDDGEAMFTSKEKPPLSSKKATIGERNEATNVKIKETMFSEEDEEAMFTSKEKPPLSSKKAAIAEKNEAANVKIKETMFSEEDGEAMFNKPMFNEPMFNEPMFSEPMFSEPRFSEATYTGNIKLPLPLSNETPTKDEPDPSDEPSENVESHKPNDDNRTVSDEEHMENDRDIVDSETSKPRKEVEEESNNINISKDEQEGTHTADYVATSTEKVNYEEYFAQCPKQCPARAMMVCARCVHGVYRTFMSTCHMRMFRCEHPEEMLQLVSRYPCLMSAPYLPNEKSAPKGIVYEPNDDDEVLKYIYCHKKLQKPKDMSMDEDDICRNVKVDTAKIILAHNNL